MAADLERQIFTLTFNSNSCDLPESTLRELFDHQGVPIVVAAFQEYDLPPKTFVPPSPFIFAGDKKGRKKLDKSLYLREMGESNADDSRMATIQSILGNDYKLLVDVAMGEPARETEVKDKENPEWYGFIRLVVWASENTKAGSILCNDDALITCVVPTGSKKTQYMGRGEGNCKQSYNEMYENDASPDKGAVAAYFPHANLLLTSVHLAGTNQYGVKEEVFDDIRVTQLLSIEKKLTYITERYSLVAGARLSDTALIFSGDLNFRVESNFQSATEKAKGGKDFQEVEKVASGGDALELASLFGDYDRLNKHLHHRRRSSFNSNHSLIRQPFPAFLMGSVDAVAESLLGSAGSENDSPLRPTFTFKVDAPYPRKYKDKRTPSWPDRILAKGRGPLLAPQDGGSAQVIKCYSLPKVVSSDHEPVVAFLELCSHQQLARTAQAVEFEHISFLKNQAEEEAERAEIAALLSIPSPRPTSGTLDCCVPDSKCSIM